MPADSSSASRRPRQLLMLAALGWLAWLAMTLCHELGHVAGARLTGGVVRRLVWHPLVLSRTDVSPNPHPLIEVWAGPIVGCALPLVALAIAWAAHHGRRRRGTSSPAPLAGEGRGEGASVDRHSTRGPGIPSPQAPPPTPPARGGEEDGARPRSTTLYLFAFIAGFCLIANGAYLGVGASDPVGDARQLLAHGAPRGTLALFGVAAVAAGLTLWHRAGPALGFGRAPREVDRRHTIAVVMVAIAFTLLGLLFGDAG